MRQATPLRQGICWVAGPAGAVTLSRLREPLTADHSAMPASASTAQDAGAPGQEPRASVSGALTPAATAPPRPSPAV
ncbi:hypothetical protein [Nonomuraea sp. NPDC005650]|uniref:hypothetical protein n=1 Tax=Nonomuraea sp. NPDC005650 TaxID=3157045 RepID=UPI0033A8D50A